MLYRYVEREGAESTRVTIFFGWRRRHTSGAEARLVDVSVMTRAVASSTPRGNMAREPEVPVSHKAVTASSGHSGGSFRTRSSCCSKPADRKSSTELLAVRGEDPSESASTQPR